MKLLPLLPLVLTLSIAHAELTAEQRQQPLEVEPPDPGLAKVVVIAGVPSNHPGQHEYFAGCALLCGLLKQNAGVAPVLVGNGWPKNESILDGAKSIVYYADGGPKLPFAEPARLEKMKALMDKGCGFVMLHQTVDIPEAQAHDVESWLGGAWTKDIGCRGHWDMEFGSFPTHPVLRGVQPFAAPMDGWLYNLHFAEQGVTPLVTGAVPDKSRSTADAKAHNGRAETIGWAYERPNGGRGFAFTGCDLHRSWLVESQRRLVVNGILWTAKVEVPEGGAKVDFRPAELAKNLDAKPGTASAAAAFPGLPAGAPGAAGAQSASVPAAAGN